MYDAESIFDALTPLDGQVDEGAVDALLLQLRGRKIAIPSPHGFRPLRLPMDVELMRPLRAIAQDDTSVVPRRLRLPAVRQVLTAPAYIYPLSPPAPAGQPRQLAMLSAFGNTDAPEYQAALVLDMVVTEDARANPRVVRLDATGRWFLGPDELGPALEQLYLSTYKPARHVPAHSTVLWLGGPPIAADLPEWADRVEAVGAVRGAKVLVRTQPGRHDKDIANEFASKSVELVVVWEPFARGATELGRTVSARTGHPAKMLAEPRLDDCLVEFGWVLDEAIYISESFDRTDASPTPPADGEERFYIKHHGSAAGDKMLRVPECNHSAWGHDLKATAPRAFKGIMQLEGIAPSSLFLCPKCSKHRWRARY